MHILVALCQCIRLFSSGTVPMYTYTSIFLWNSAKACLYTLVALCQSIPLFPSGTVPKHASASIYVVALYQRMHILVALCQCIRLFSSGTMPMYTYTSIFLWNSVNACLYEYFLVVLYQCMLYMYAS